MRAPRAEVDSPSVETTFPMAAEPTPTTLPMVAEPSLTTSTPLVERQPKASLLGSLGDLAPAKPMYMPKQANDMRRVGLDALEADGEL